jgi:hypothetical protein
VAVSSSLVGFWLSTISSWVGNNKRPSLKAIVNPPSLLRCSDALPLAAPHC